MSFMVLPDHNSTSISSIQTLRGLAAFAVAWFHFTKGFPDIEWLYLSGSRGGTGVLVFFIISGFILPYSMYQGQYRIKSAHLFLAKRIIRIDPPYLFTIALILFLNFLASNVSSYQGPHFYFEPIRLLSHLAYLPDLVGTKWVGGVCWTLAIEFQFYVSLMILYPLLVRDKKVAYPICLVLFLISFISPGNNFFYYTRYFLFGIIAFRWYIKLDSFSVFFASITILFSSIVYSYDYFYAILSILTITIILSPHKRIAGFMFLGEISYSLYLLHGSIGGRTIGLAKRYVDNGPLESLLLCLLALLLSVIAATLVYLFIEKPSKRLARKILYSKSN